MRIVALAAAIAASISLGSVADARTWTDPNGRLAIDVPNNWVITAEPAEGFTYVIAGTANNECQFAASPNPGSANASAYQVRRTAGTDDQFTESLWMQFAQSMGPVFRRSPPVFVSRSRDDTGFWPVQRAEFTAGERAVHAGLQLRPGVDIRGFCLTYDGADPVQLYEQILRSMGHPNDATFRADAERQIAEHDAAAAAAAAAAQQQQQQQQQQQEQQRNRRRN